MKKQIDFGKKIGLGTVKQLFDFVMNKGVSFFQVYHCSGRKGHYGRNGSDGQNEIGRGRGFDNFLTEK